MHISYRARLRRGANLRFFASLVARTLLPTPHHFPTLLPTRHSRRCPRCHPRRSMVAFTFSCKFCFSWWHLLRGGLRFVVGILFVVHLHFFWLLNFAAHQTMPHPTPPPTTASRHPTSARSARRLHPDDRSSYRPSCRRASLALHTAPDLRFSNLRRCPQRAVPNATPDAAPDAAPGAPWWSSLPLFSLHRWPEELQMPGSRLREESKTTGAIVRA